MRASRSASMVVPRASAARAITRSCIGVSMMPGQTVLTRTPRGPWTLAKVREMHWTAAFEAA